MMNTKYINICNTIILIRAKSRLHYTLYHADLVLCIILTWCYLSRRRDTMYHADLILCMMQTQYYVSHRHDTSFEASFRHDLAQTAREERTHKSSVQKDFFSDQALGRAQKIFHLPCSLPWILGLFPEKIKKNKKKWKNHIHNYNGLKHEITQ